MNRILVGLFIVNSAAVIASGDEAEFRPNQSQLPVPAPEDAVIVFDGTENRFVSMAGTPINWPVNDECLVSTRGQAAPGKARSNHILSSYHFRDADIHVEFQLPPDGPGNSGLYLHGNYELQILNSIGAKKLTQQEMGSLYGFAPPLVNAARKRGEWQVYDVRYRAPRRDAAGNIVEDGRLTAWLNGQRVQHNTTFAEPRSSYHPFRHGRTPYLEAVESRLHATMTGPLFLQDHDSQVRFRNVWIKPLDKHGAFFRAKEESATNESSPPDMSTFNALSKSEKMDRIVAVGQQLNKGIRSTSGWYTYILTDKTNDVVLSRANLQLHFDNDTYCLDCEWKTRKQSRASLNGVAQTGFVDVKVDRMVVLARPHTAKIISSQEGLNAAGCSILNLSPRKRGRKPFLRDVMTQAGFGYVYNPLFLHRQIMQLEDLLTAIEPDALSFVATSDAAVRIEFAVINSPQNIVSLDYDQQLRPIGFAIRHPAKNGEYMRSDITWDEQYGVSVPVRFFAKQRRGDRRLEYKFERVAGTINKPVDPKFFDVKRLNIPADAEVGSWPGPQ